MGVFCLHPQIFAHLDTLHLRSKLDGTMIDGFLLSIPLLMDGNMFQNRSVSSPAPVTIFSPHGLIER